LRILVVRTDRIGDLVLTTPLAGILKKKMEGVRVDFLVLDYAAPILKGYKYVDHILTISKSYKIDKLVRKIKKKYDVAIVAHPEFRLAIALYLATIPIRIGTGYRLYSLLFNRRVYEHRRYGGRHEIEYNISLLRQLQVEPEFFTTYASVEESPITIPDNSIVIHPGGLGSSLYWPSDRFLYLGKFLKKRGFNVYYLLGPAEVQMKEYYPNPIFQQFTLPEIGGILSKASLFIGSNSGILHIASAVNTPSIGIFPCAVNMNGTRWGPVGGIAVEPPLPECNRCIFERCRFYNCMGLISVERVGKIALSLLDGKIKLKTDRVLVYKGEEEPLSRLLKP